MESWLPVLAPALFLVVFPVFWCFVVGLLGFVGGWARLGDRYGTRLPPHGKTLRWQSGSLGLVSYRNVINIASAPEGLFLSVAWPFRIAHPPLFIPWSDVHDAFEERGLWWRQVRFSIGSPSRARMRLPAQAFEAVDAGRARLDAGRT
jgi:hypothetical protein